MASDVGCGAGCRVREREADACRDPRPVLDAASWTGESETRDPERRESDPRRNVRSLRLRPKEHIKIGAVYDRTSPALRACRTTVGRDRSRRINVRVPCARRQSRGFRDPRWMEEEWSEIPCCRRKGLGNRLQSKNFKQFVEAYFELQVHRLLRRMGLEIDIEPSLAGTDKTVDFRCTAPGTPSFFVEATVSGLNRLSANQNLEDVRRKIIEGVARPHSHVDLEVEGRLETTLSSLCCTDVTWGHSLDCGSLPETV